MQMPMSKDVKLTPTDKTSADALVLPNRIQEYRKARGLSAEELAERTELSPSYITRMERGERNVSLKNLQKLADALGCVPQDLIGTDAISQQHRDIVAPKNRIQEYRKARGLSAEELAELAELSPSFISLMERGLRNLSLKNLQKLAEALGCTPQDLIGWDVEATELGEIIHAQRKLKGWTQAELAQQIGMSSGAVSQFESNAIKPTPAVLTELSKVFGLSADGVLAGLPVDRPAQAVNPVVQVDPVLVAAWEKMTVKQRRKLVQIAVLLSED
jgi:transcriptional regulator with XRE-family HTH domain